MASILSRFSEASATCLMCTDRLSWPVLFPFGPDFETEFCGYHYLSTEGSKRFTHKFFVREGAMRFRSVEKRDATFDGSPNQ